ncbi:Uncharacterized protein TCAP_05727, partial [Tolypocladium capitatum]
REQDAALRLPNFPALARGLKVVSDEAALLANLPAVDGGVRIVDRRDSFEQAIQTRLDRFEQATQATQTSLDSLEENMQRDFDNLAKRIEALDLKVAVTVVTGEVIDTFPRTLGDLESLSIRQVDELLRQLGEPVQGVANERKRLLKYAVGVMTQVV